MAASKVSVKLLIDTKGRKLYLLKLAKTFAYFLFYLLSLPVDSVLSN